MDKLSKKFIVEQYIEMCSPNHSCILHLAVSAAVYCSNIEQIKLSTKCK